MSKPVDPYRNLALQAREGNLRAVQQLVKDYLPFIYRLHCRLSMDPVEAEKYVHYTVRNIRPAFVQYRSEKETFRAFLIRLTIFCRNHERTLDKMESIPFLQNLEHKEHNDNLFKIRESIFYKMLGGLDLVGRILFSLIRLENVPIKEVETALSLDHNFIVEKLSEVNEQLSSSEAFKDGIF